MVEISKPHRRWFQYSLRALLVFMVLVAIGLSWLAVKIQQARDQRLAVEAIQKLDGCVWYHYQIDPSGDRIYNAAPPGPAWLRDVLGEDPVATVVRVTFASSVGPSITDADLELLQGLKQLRWLDLTQTQVTDAGLDRLAGLRQLQELNVAHAPIVGTGLVHLKGLPRLHILSLCDMEITDVGLEQIKGLTQLRMLLLEGTQITDAALEHLKGLTHLEHLSLNYTQITDAGLVHLTGMIQLRGLDVMGTKVTEDGVRKLQQALPQCHIAQFHFAR